MNVRSTYAFFLGCLLLCTVPASAWAQTRVVVEDFKGTKANARAVRGAVVEVLEKHDVELVAPSRAKKVASSSGAELDTESGRVRVAKRLQLQALIEGSVRAVNKKMQVDVVAYSGRDGSRAAEYRAVVPKTQLLKTLRAKLWPALKPALVPNVTASKPAPAPVAAAPVVEAPLQPQAQVPVATPRVDRGLTGEPSSVPGPQDADEEEDEREDASVSNLAPPEPTPRAPKTEVAAPTRPSSASSFDLAVGLNGMIRSFGYNDSLPGLRPYTLSFSPAFSFRAHWYPGSYFTDTWLSNLGLDLRADVLLGVRSENQTTGDVFDTSGNGWGVGVRQRFLFDPLELGVVLGFGQRSFSLKSTADVDPEVPDVTYSFLRLAGEARYQILEWLAAQVKLGFLYGLSLGDLSSDAWFPHASGHGVEFEIGGEVKLNPVFSVEAAFAFQRFFMSLNPEPGDEGVVGPGRVAGGATDRYYFLRLGGILRL